MTQTFVFKRSFIDFIIESVQALPASDRSFNPDIYERSDEFFDQPYLFFVAMTIVIVLIISMSSVKLCRAHKRAIYFYNPREHIKKYLALLRDRMTTETAQIRCVTSACRESHV